MNTNDESGISPSVHPLEGIGKFVPDFLRLFVEAFLDKYKGGVR